jgi:hypothetical protein
LLEEDWATLRTYEQALADMHGKGNADGGQNPLIAQAQRYGGG